MKLIHALAMACAASVLPSAWAQSVSVSHGDIADPGRPFSITAVSDGASLHSAQLTYPARAAMLGESGACTLKLQVNAAGRAAAAEAPACTSPLFQETAERIGRTARFGAGNTASLRIEWRFEPEAVTTASLR